MSEEKMTASLSINRKTERGNLVKIIEEIKMDYEKKSIEILKQNGGNV